MQSLHRKKESKYSNCVGTVQRTHRDGKSKPKREKRKINFFPQPNRPTVESGASYTRPIIKNLKELKRRPLKELWRITRRIWKKIPYAMRRDYPGIFNSDIGSTTDIPIGGANNHKHVVNMWFRCLQMTPRVVVEPNLIQYNLLEMNKASSIRKMMLDIILMGKYLLAGH